mmetsp:Transcript_14698/g.52912  ORF Transcript_14698/g.52912 Transcript_14698/m.52912 type:complete len:91 (-) Transcript_14698:94-366(-)
MEGYSTCTCCTRKKSLFFPDKSGSTTYRDYNNVHHVTQATYGIPTMLCTCRVFLFCKEIQYVCPTSLKLRSVLPEICPTRTVRVQLYTYV